MVEQGAFFRTLLVLCLLWGCSNESDPGTEAQNPPMGVAGGGATPGSPTMPGDPSTMGGDPGTVPSDPSTMGGDPGTVPSDPATVDNPPDPVGDMPPGDPQDELVWETLITADWQLAPNEETTYCQRVTLTEDVYFRGIRALNPRGTHHTAFTVGAPSAFAPDGLTRACGSALSPQGIFGSGVGTDMVIYPPGVGMWLRAGQQMLLNLHVYNTSDAPLTGTSGAEVVMTTVDQIEHVAESLLAGPAFFSIPPGVETVVTGYCTANANNTLFAVQPHMHQLGVHMKGVAENSARGEVLLHDGPFEFENQVVVPLAEPLEMRQGDRIRVECTFNNPTDQTVTFGESSDTEMCFLVLHRYPAPASPAVTCIF